jgi:hypothetical protein
MDMAGLLVAYELRDWFGVPGWVADRFNAPLGTERLPKSRVRAPDA